MGKTCNQVCVGLAIFFAVVLFIVNVIFSFKYKNYEFENNKILSEINNSLNGKIIYSLTAKDSCDSNENQLIFGEWDGSEEGCYCSSSEIYKRECNENEIKKGCTYVRPLGSKQYNKLNSKYLCIKNSEKTYLELLKTEQIVSKNSNCPVGYKSCGTIDTLENKFCTLSNEDCPINMNKINENFNLYLQNEYESYPIGYTSNNNLENQIISIFQISEDYPCIYPGEKTWSYNYDLEPLDKTCSTPIKGRINDDRYEKMINYNTTKEDLYKDNNIVNYGPPHGDIEKIVYLYGRSFLGFEKGKMAKFSYDSIISVQNVSNNCGTVMRYLSTALLIFLSLPVIVIVGCVCGTGGRPPSCSGEEFGCALMTCGIGGSITGVLAFVIDFILCIIIFVCTIMIKTKLPSKVGDEYTNEFIQVLLDEGSKNLIFSIAVVSILVATLIPLVILLINCIRHGGELDF